MVNKSFGNVVKFIYMGKTFQNCIHERSQEQIQFGESMLSSSLSSYVLFISVWLRIYKTIIWYLCGAYSNDKDYALLWYDAVFISTSMATSQRNLLSQSSWSCKKVCSRGGGSISWERILINYHSQSMISQTVIFLNIKSHRLEDVWDQDDENIWIKEERSKEAGENCIMRMLIICNRQYY